MLVGAGHWWSAPISVCGLLVDEGKQVLCVSRKVMEWEDNFLLESLTSSWLLSYDVALTKVLRAGSHGSQVPSPKSLGIDACDLSQ